MMNRTLAIAVTLLMTVSGFSMATALSDQSDAAPIGEFEIGDAWGAGGDITLEEVVGYVSKLVPEGDVADQIEKLKDLLKAFLEDHEIKNDKYDAEASFWEIGEIVEKDASGYVMELGNSATLEATLSATVSGPLPYDLSDLYIGMNLKDDTLVVEELSAIVSLNGHGSAYFDRDFRFLGCTMDEQLTLGLRANTNLDISEEGRISYLKGATVDRDISLALDTVTDLSVIGEGLQFLPEKDSSGKAAMEWTSGFDLATTVVGSVYLDAPFLDTALSEGISVGDITEMELEFEAVEENGVYTITADSDDEEIGIDGFPELDEILDSISDVEYKYPFGANEVPPMLDAFKGFELTPSEAENAWSHIDETSGKVADFTKGRELTVSFMDGDSEIPGLPAVTVAYGDTISLPKLPASVVLGPDEVFLGWGAGHGALWDDSYPVKHDLVLEPMIADKVQKMPGKDEFHDNGCVLWKSDVDSVRNAVLGNDLLRADDVLLIEVSDADGRILYEWKLSGGSNIPAGTKLMPEIVEQDVPAKDYLSEIRGDDPAVYLDFKASGTMPADTAVRYHVGGSFSAGGDVRVYYDDGESARLSGTAVVDDDGYIVMPLKHCSGYMLVGSGSETGSEESGSNMMAIGIIVGILAVAAAVAIVIKSKRKSA